MTEIRLPASELREALIRLRPFRMKGWDSEAFPQRFYAITVEQESVARGEASPGFTTHDVAVFRAFDGYRMAEFRTPYVGSDFERFGIYPGAIENIEQMLRGARGQVELFPDGVRLSEDEYIPFERTEGLPTTPNAWPHEYDPERFPLLGSATVTTKRLREAVKTLRPKAKECADLYNAQHARHRKAKVDGGTIRLSIDDGSVELIAGIEGYDEGQCCVLLTNRTYGGGRIALSVGFLSDIANTSLPAVTLSLYGDKQPMIAEYTNRPKGALGKLRVASMPLYIWEDKE